MGNYLELTKGVRITKKDPIDGDRYIAADINRRDEYIVEDRVHNGLQVYVLSEKKLYLLLDKDSTPPDWEEITFGASSATGNLKSDGTVDMDSGYWGTNAQSLATSGMIEATSVVHTDSDSMPADTYGKDYDTYTRFKTVSASTSLYTAASSGAWIDNTNGTVIIDGNVSIGGTPSANVLMTISLRYNKVVMSHDGEGIPQKDNVLDLDGVGINLIFRGIQNNYTYWDFNGSDAAHMTAVHGITTSTIVTFKGKKLSGTSADYVRINGKWIYNDEGGIENVHQAIVGDHPTKAELILALGKVHNIDYSLNQKFTMYDKALGLGTDTKGYSVFYYANGATTGFGTTSSGSKPSTIWANEQHLDGIYPVEFPEAPTNGLIYGRKNSAWVNVDGYETITWANLVAKTTRKTGERYNISTGTTFYGNKTFGKVVLTTADTFSWTGDDGVFYPIIIIRN